MFAVEEEAYEETKKEAPKDETEIQVGSLWVNEMASARVSPCLHQYNDE